MTIKDIEHKAKDFNQYLQVAFKQHGIIDILDEWTKETGVYIFSGVIRDYFINSNHFIPKDLDIVVDDLDKCLPTIKCEYTINKYGGLKLHILDFEIDVWQLDKTWGIKQLKYEPTPKNLIKTAFFNYSAIVFDYRNKQFVVGQPFIDFLNHQTIDYVFLDNPCPMLCVITAAHYVKKYGLQISERLKVWMYSELEKDVDLSKSQLDHYGFIEFNKKNILKVIEQ